MKKNKVFEVFQAELGKNDRSIGYRALVEKFDLCVHHFRWSFVSSWERRQVPMDGMTLFFYPKSYDPGKGLYGNLEFALKHEGINLLILKRVLEKCKVEEVANIVLENPKGKYRRMIWYLYETFFNTKLDISDIYEGNYVHLLDPKKYYVAKMGRSKRHRIINNLLGSMDFCPVVRKTATLDQFEKKQLNKLTHDLAQKYDPEVIARAMQYLYTKETLSSWEIEREKPDKARLAKFTGILRKIDKIKALSQEVMVALQKEIVDERFVLEGYRDFQNYVGEEPGLNQLILHYIAPKPENVASLMSGLFVCFENMIASDGHGVIAAAILSFGFVFMHPFWDGNGRLHRFLIHYALSRYQFTPKEVIFPISAVMLRQQKEYDRALESFSRPLLECITKYKVDEAGEMTVHQDTLDYYCFIDFTDIAEYLFSVVERTITTDFEKELIFLTKYDQIKRDLKKIVQMPDQKIDLFIRLVYQNEGKLSERKRSRYFEMLSDEEIHKMEHIITKFS